MFWKWFNRSYRPPQVLPPRGKSVMRDMIPVSLDAAELIENLKRERDRLKAEAVDSQRIMAHQQDIILDQQREIADLKRESADDKLWIRAVCRMAAQRGEAVLAGDEARAG